MICFDLDHPSPFAVRNEYIRAVRVYISNEKQDEDISERSNCMHVARTGMVFDGIKAAIEAASQELVAGIANVTGDTTISA